MLSSVGYTDLTDDTTTTALAMNIQPHRVTWQRNGEPLVINGNDYDTLGGEGSAVVGCRFGIYYICHMNELMFTLIPAVTEALSTIGHTVADECKVSDTLQEVSH